MSVDSLRVAVVGGGIGGMAAANFLHARGLTVDVYEQAGELGEVGAGVQLTPNSIRLLDRLGVGGPVRAAGVALDEDSHYYRSDGSSIGPVLTTSSDRGEHVYGMHRADLLSILSSRLRPGAVHTGHRCTGFEQDGGGVTLRFENGRTAVADVAIGADGIHSRLQQEVTEPSRPIHSGSVAYRGLVESDDVGGWPRSTFELWMGRGKHLIVFPVRAGTLLNYVGFVPSREEARESWSARGNPEELRRAFRGWDPRLEKLLSRITTTFWWGLYDREPLERWTVGRLTLLGDAAHPMLPHLGQGVNQSIEDGAALATMLAHVDRDAVPEALGRYEALRRPRTSEVQRGSRANGNRYDSAYDDLDRRDAEIAETRSFRLWLYDYDVEAEAENAASA